MLSECVKCVWNKMCVGCCLRGWGSECMEVGKGWWLCVYEGCVDQCGGVEFSVFMEIFSVCTVQ